MILMNYLIFVYTFTIYCLTSDSLHNQPFGSGPKTHVAVFDGNMDPETFFKEYICTKTPILFKNAAKSFPAYKLWNDFYFLNMNLTEFDDDSVVVEQNKKENRKTPTLKMDFKKFIKSYRHSDIYMVNKLPDFLKQDVLLPWMLQCDFWTDDSLVEVLAWFSNGDTSSVVHTDDMENINCVIRGNKTFILVDPELHGDKIHLTSDGAFAEFDVDRVDLEKYPEIANLDYFIAEVEAGDCFYIPKKWIHQVRSSADSKTQSNYAVNIWFDRPHYEIEMKYATQENLGQCSSQFNDTLTIADFPFASLDYGGLNREGKETIFENLKNQNADRIFSMIEKMYPELDQLDERYHSDIVTIINDIMRDLDLDSNGTIEEEELSNLNSEIVNRIYAYLFHIKAYLGSAIKGLNSSRTSFNQKLSSQPKEEL